MPIVPREQLYVRNLVSRGRESLPPFTPINQVSKSIVVCTLTWRNSQFHFKSSVSLENVCFINISSWILRAIIDKAIHTKTIQKVTPSIVYVIASKYKEYMYIHICVCVYIYINVFTKIIIFKCKIYHMNIIMYIHCP